MRLAAHVLAAFAALTGFIGAAFADQPVPWGIGMQDAATPVMEDIHWFNNFTLIIAIAVTLLVFVLLLVVLLKFNASANPTPSKRSHHTMLEVAWTLVPILILVAIAVPSFRLLYKELEVPEADLTIKATGYQWYWGYEYTDDGYDGLSFDAVMLGDDERAERIEKRGLTERDVPRLLAVDNQVIVPVGKVVRVQVTAADVIHSFAVPAFGIKVDAVPGRLNETWFQAERTGVYFGQCSELCGSRHAFMPISVRVVTEEQFAAWSAAAKDDIDAAYEALMASVKADRKAIDVAKR
ncbi:cytochrome c oxidase subunit II [Rhodobium orientis]|uniref:Cytochrome c oxidase subunit 2 n=1 Tax=Rhodobium orientis TaxID=34017 RepID=A0A327JPS6_9HYPH|nr:cytochrome c oxidase subunit II [Rhodobium orientis]MBK5950686.1 cytochrome c oxidase subunit II [Rhodobium orientis]RAI28061.1 cytochrome c oxidase subunit II [Rhodobium orientis]